MHCVSWYLDLDLQFARESSVKAEARKDISLITLVVELCLPENLLHQCFAYALFALTKTGHPDSESAFHLLREARSSLFPWIDTKSKPHKKAFLHCASFYCSIRNSVRSAV